MKNVYVTLLAATLALLGTGGFGQDWANDLKDRVRDAIDNPSQTVGKIGGAVIGGVVAKKQAETLVGELKKLNAKQPGFPFTNGSFIVEFDDGCTLSDEEKATVTGDVRAMLKQQGVDASVVWTLPEIEQETAERQSLRGNDEVDQTSMPGKGTIQRGWFKIKMMVRKIESREDIEAFIGRIWHGAEFQSDTQTSRWRMTATIWDTHGGEGGAVYRSVGSASSADNIGGSITGSVLGDLGGRYHQEDDEGRDLRAMSKASEGLGQVFLAKNSSKKKDKGR